MRERRFWKMSGSGNDFVVFDATHEPAGDLERPLAIAALCERRTGVGADGVVFLEPHPRHAFSMRYFNRDGTLAEMCGNAALCSARLASTLGIAGGGDFTFETTSGPISARVANDLPQIDMVPVTELESSFETDLEAGERRIGFARVGVPHLVVEVDDVEIVDVISRGRYLRRLPTLVEGANANFVSRLVDGRWAMRTYERGVEDETLACGTGAVAATALLSSWGLGGTITELVSRSRKTLRVRLPDYGSSLAPRLEGEGRIVYSGVLAELDPF